MTMISCSNQVKKIPTNETLHYHNFLEYVINIANDSFSIADSVSKQSLIWYVECIIEVLIKLGYCREADPAERDLNYGLELKSTIGEIQVSDYLKK